MIPVADNTAQSGVFPILDEDGKMDVSIVNTEDLPAFMTLEAVDADGTILARADRFIRGFNKLWVESAQELMTNPGQDAPDLSGARYIRYASTRLMSGLQINGSDGSFRDSTMVDSLIAQPYPLREAYALTMENGVRSGIYPFGRRMSISADIPADWVIFTKWTSDDPWSLERVDNIHDPNTLVTMPAGPVTIQAEYTRKSATTYRLDIEHGRPSGDYTAGRVIPVRADDDPELFFDRWIGTGAKFLTRINVPSPQMLMPREPVLIEATYSDTPPTPHELTVIRGRPSGSTVQYSGRVVRIFAHLPPTLDEMFDKWVGQAFPVANVNLPDTRLTMPNEDIFIEATFKPIPEGEFALTIQTEVPESDSQVRSEALVHLTAYRATQAPRPGQWTTIEAPAAPEGLVFAAWTGQTAYVENVTNPRTRLYMPDHDVTVVATYREIEDAQRYQVLYDANQGDNPPEDAQRYPHNAKVTVQGPGAITRDGYAFMSWHDRPNRDEARLDDRDYLPGDVFLMPAENKTLYAQWIGENDREQMVRAGCLASCHHTTEEFDGLRMTRAQWDALSAAT